MPCSRSAATGADLTLSVPRRARNPGAPLDESRAATRSALRYQCSLAQLAYRSQAEALALSVQHAVVPLQIAEYTSRHDSRAATKVYLPSCSLSSTAYGLSEGAASWNILDHWPSRAEPFEACRPDRSGSCSRQLSGPSRPLWMRLSAHGSPPLPLARPLWYTRHRHWGVV